MADKELRVRLEADDKITPAAKKAKGSLDDIPDKKTVEVEAKGLDDLTSKIGGLPGPLGEAGELIGQLGAAGGIGALAVGMFATADAAADLAIEAQTTADLTGSTVEDASKLQNLWGRTGADVNDLNDVLLQMNGVLSQSPELAKQIGVNLNDGKDITQRFVEVTDLLASGQLSAVQASQLFGEEGVRQVGKLRTMYGGLSDDLENMPAPVDDEDVDQAIEMKKAVADLKNILTTTVGIVGKELVPLFGDLATLANGIAAALPGGKDGGGAQVLGWVREYGTGIGLIAKGVAAVAGGPDIDVGLDPAIDNLANYKAQLADTGPTASDAAKEIAAAYLKLIGVSARQESATREVAGAYADVVVGMIEAEAAAADYSDTVGSMEFATADVEAGATAMSAFSDSFFGVPAAVAESEAAIDTFVAALKETGLTFDLTSEAGRKNQEALEGVARTLDDDFAKAYADADGDMDTFKASAKTISDQTLTRLQDELGLSAEDTQTLATHLGLLPEDIETRYQLAGTEEARIKIGLLQGSIAALPKSVQTEVNQRIIVGDYQGALNVIQGYYNSHPATVKVNTVAGVLRNPFGGVFGGAAPAAATATATATGPSTYAAPAAATYGPAPIYINVPAPAPTSVTVQAGVVGNRFDVNRAVTKAFRRHQRLNGRRP